MSFHFVLVRAFVLRFLVCCGIVLNFSHFLFFPHFTHSLRSSPSPPSSSPFSIPHTGLRYNGAHYTGLIHPVFQRSLPHRINKQQQPPADTDQQHHTEHSPSPPTQPQSQPDDDFIVGLLHDMNKREEFAQYRQEARKNVWFDLIFELPPPPSLQPEPTPTSPAPSPLPHHQPHQGGPHQPQQKQQHGQHAKPHHPTPAPNHNEGVVSRGEEAVRVAAFAPLVD